MTTSVGSVGPATMPVPFGRILVFALVPGLLVVDLANGLVGEGAGLAGLPFSLGEAIRGVVFVSAMLALVTVREPAVARIGRWVLVLAGVLALGTANGLRLGADTGDLAFDVAKGVKTLYGPALAGLLAWAVYRQGARRIDLVRALAWFGALAGVGVLVFRAVGLGEATYGRWSTAHKGYFLAPNDLGLAMGIAVVAGAHLLLRRPASPIAWLRVVLTCVGMLGLGTRMGTVGAVVIPAAIAMVHAARIRRWHQAILAGGFAGIAAALLGVMTVQRVEQLRAEPYQWRKYERLAGGELTRVFLLAAAFEHLSRRDVASQIVGEGPSRYQLGVHRASGRGAGRDLAEVDWVDLFGGHGLLGLLLVYAFYVRTGIRWRRWPRSERMTATLAVVGLGVYLAHATLAGHAISGPLPSGALAPWLAILWLPPRLT